jgi:uncharacterized membrane protein
VANSYHRVSGQSVGRIEALSDGIFAVAMTLLVLNLKVPVNRALHGERLIWQAGALANEHVVASILTRLAPTISIYVLSFLTLGIFWVGQQAQLECLARSNRHLTWLHLTFLLAISIMPFSTALLAQYINFRLALVEYWLHLLVLGLLLLACLRYADSAGLHTPEAPAVRQATERRIIVSQVLYFCCVLLCVISTYLSITLIILLQLISATAPKIRPFDRF